jgi:predicted metal-dependent hydrolase
MSATQHIAAQRNTAQRITRLSHETITGYTLIRSKRKTVAIYIRDGCLEVRAPLKMPKHSIERFVISKEKWITDRLTMSREHSKRREMFALNYGDTVTLRGSEHAIIAKKGARAGFDGTVFFLSPDLVPEQIKSVCIQIYRRLAKAYISERVSYYAQKMSVTPAMIKITSAKNRWGSCSAKKSINFSWRLIMADDDAIDYVVVHELAHLAELNHSERFWAIVGNILPDYRERQKLLRELQQKLNTEKWD